MSDEHNMIEIDFEAVVYETIDAWNLDLGENQQGSGRIWQKFSKSLCDFDDRNNIIYVPLWLAEERGLGQRRKMMSGYDDPNHPGNSPKYHTGSLCIEGCGRPAGTAWSPYWCMECNIKRINHITKQLNKLPSRRKGGWCEKEI